MHVYRAIYSGDDLIIDVTNGNEMDIVLIKTDQNHSYGVILSDEIGEPMFVGFTKSFLWSFYLSVIEII